MKNVLFYLWWFNARIGNLNDYVTDDDNRQIPALLKDYVADEPLKRMSQDWGINVIGHLLINVCRQIGLRIANGRVCKMQIAGSALLSGLEDEV